MKKAIDFRHNHVTKRKMTFRCRVVMRGYKNRKGENQLYLNTNINQERSRIPLEIYLQKSDFDANKQQVRKTHRSAKDYNDQIEDAKAKAIEINTDARLSKRTLTKNEFEYEYKNAAAKDDFMSYMKSEIRKQIGTLSPGTISGHLTSFQKFNNFRHILSFNELTPELMEQFDAHLKNKLHNSLNTRHKVFKNIKKYVNRALLQGKKFRSPFLVFKPKTSKTQKVWLTKDEVQRLLNLYYDPAILAGIKNVLKYFLFSCFTSLRLSDVKMIHAEQIVNDAYYHRPKKLSHLDKGVEIPIISIAKNFITVNEGVLFKPISDQKTNKKLKLIAELAQINKRLTFHVARRTYGKLFLQTGGKIQVLQKIYGHSKIEQTMDYVDVDSEQIHEDAKLMENLNFTIEVSDSPTNS